MYTISKFHGWLSGFSVEVQLALVTRFVVRPECGVQLAWVVKFAPRLMVRGVLFAQDPSHGPSGSLMRWGSVQSAFLPIAPF